MRPLTHLGVGPNSADYELYSTNEELYDKLSDRGEQLIENAKKAYMGHYYGNPPKLTLKELQEQFDNQVLRRERLVALKAPKEILQGEDSVTVKLYRDINNKNYGSMSDPVYKQYLEAYCKKENDWTGSKELETILNEIYSYNEAEYNNFKLQQEFAPR
jgi:hypothetical protein